MGISPCKCNEESMNLGPEGNKSLRQCFFRSFKRLRVALDMSKSSVLKLFFILCCMAMKHFTTQNNHKTSKNATNILPLYLGKKTRNRVWESKKSIIASKLLDQPRVWPVLISAFQNKESIGKVKEHFHLVQN